MTGLRHATGRLSTSSRVLLKELGAFGVVGIVGFLLDVGLFQLFYDVLHVDAVPAKILSSLVSMTVAYFGHRFWSFSHRAQTGLRREYLLFAAVNGGSLLLGVAVVAIVRYPLGQESALVLQAANIASIVLSTVVRYLCYRTWVFPAVTPEGESSTPDQNARRIN